MLAPFFNFCFVLFLDWTIILRAQVTGQRPSNICEPKQVENLAPSRLLGRVEEDDNFYKVHYELEPQDHSGGRILDDHRITEVRGRRV